ncbi:MAG: hypothetical protein WBW16_05040 [Bacteroidota bacterium]
MKRALIPVIICLLFLSQPFAQKKGGSPAQDERVMQTLAVFSGERKIISDFVLRIRWMQGVDILTALTEGMKVTRMDVAYENDQFKFFKVVRDNKDELTVKVRRDSFSISHVVKGNSSLPRKGDEIILEPNAYGEYAFLLSHYNAAKGGEQTFRALVPSEHRIIPVTVERHGSDRFQCGEVMIDAVHHKVTLEKKDLVHVWSLRDGKVIAFRIPSKGLCVVDEAYENLHQNVRALALGGL